MSNNLGRFVNGEIGETVVEMIGPANALSNEDALSKGLYALSEVIIRGLQPDRDGGGLGGRFGYGADFENDVFLMHHFCWCESENCLWCGGSGCQEEHLREDHREGCYQVRLQLLARQFGEPLADEHPDYYHVPYGSPNTRKYDAAKLALCKELHQNYKLGNEVHCSCGVDTEWKARYDSCQCNWHLGKGQFRFGAAVSAPNFWHKPSGLRVEWYKWIGRDMEISDSSLTVGKWQAIWAECFESLPTEARERAQAESKADAEREADPEYRKQKSEMYSRMFQTMKSIHDTCEREGHDDATGHCKRCGLITDFQRGFAVGNEQPST